MKMRKICQCIVFFAFLFSCSDENLPSSGEFLPKMLGTSNRIDIKEAASLAEDIATLLDEKQPSKSGSGRKVNSVSVLRFGNIKSSVLRSGEYDDIGISDTLAYVFNFEDSLGYAIVSNDKRVDSPLLAFVKKGSLINGQTDNPGLILFLERLEGYVLESIIKSSKTYEQKPETAAQRGASVVFEVGPLVSVEWGQQKPFSNNVGGQCDSTNNGKYRAGCVATTTAQIMSYWEYPASLPGSSTSYSWSLINKYKHSADFDDSPKDNLAEKLKKAMARAMVADLFQQIGTGVSMIYGCDGSYSSTLRALNFLVSNGFTLSFTPSLVSLNTGLVKAFLLLKRPFLALGCDRNGKGCHSWIIDGFLELKIGQTSFAYMHNNWGWDRDRTDNYGNNGNGYFYSGIFNPLIFDFQDVEIGSVYR